MLQDAYIQLHSLLTTYLTTAGSKILGLLFFLSKPFFVYCYADFDCFISAISAFICVIISASFCSHCLVFQHPVAPRNILLSFLLPQFYQDFFQALRQDIQ